VLDTVLADVQRVRSRAGRDDATKLDAYLQSVREL
jgi:hypothetical protein